MKKLLSLIILFTAIVVCYSGRSDADDAYSEFAQPNRNQDGTYYVSINGSDRGNGSSSHPFRTITRAVSAAKSGGKIIITKGTYTPNKKILIPASFSSSAKSPLIITGESRDAVIVKRKGMVFRVYAPYVTIENITLDGNWGDRDIIKIESKANYFTLNNAEVRNTRRDAVDFSAPYGARVLNSKIHDALWFKNGKRNDAHGIVTGGVKKMLIKGTEIYYVSGDALQFQYGGWDKITIEDCILWNGKLPSPRAGAPKGVYPGENALDTKHRKNKKRGRIFIKNVTAYGWKSNYIRNAAAFNIKHNVKVVLDGITAFDNEIAFRLRGPGSKGGAWVYLSNGVIYNNTRAIRYEDKIEKLYIYNTTFGLKNRKLFESAGGHGRKFGVKNCLFLGNKKPSEASHSSNLAISDLSTFANAAAHDYHLKANSPAINKGITIRKVTKDRDKKLRDSQYDIGAYEY